MIHETQQVAAHESFLLTEVSVKEAFHFRLLGDDIASHSASGCCKSTNSFTAILSQTNFLFIAKKENNRANHYYAVWAQRDETIRNCTSAIKDSDISLE